LNRACELFSGAIRELDAQTDARPTREPSVGKKIVHETPRFRFASPQVLRAAAVLALMVLVFTATPARAWLVSGWEALKSLVVSESAGTDETVDVPEEPGVEMSSILRFTPRGSEFRLEFTERQSGGTLVLLFDSTASASAGILGEGSGEEMILLPNGLRVRNSAGSTSSYEVQLPLSLSVVEVRVAGGAVLRIDVSAETGAMRRELSLAGS